MATGKRRRKFTLGEAAAIAGITPKLLALWIDRGLVQPAQEAQGRGTHRLFSEVNLLELKVIAGLRGLGVTFEGIEPLTAAVRSITSLEELPERALLVRQPDGEVRLIGEGEAGAIVPGPPAPLLTVPLWWYVALVLSAIDAQKVGTEEAVRKTAARIVEEDERRNGPAPIDEAFLKFYEARHGQRGTDGSKDDDDTGHGAVAEDHGQEGPKSARQRAAPGAKARRRVAGRSAAA